MELKQKYTVAEATKLLGFKSRNTINKRTNGTVQPSLSYEMDDEGNKVISVVELKRVFPDKFDAAIKRIAGTTGTASTEDKEIHQRTNKNLADAANEAQKIRELEVDLKHAQELLQMERDNLAEIKTEKARLMDMLENQTRLLVHLKEEIAKKPPEMPVERRRGFWNALLRKSS